jgi:hypothetical protein
MPDSSEYLLSSTFLHQNPLSISFLPRAHHMPPPHLIILHLITKLYLSSNTIHCFSLCSHCLHHPKYLLPRWPKFLLQHAISERPQPVFLL